MKISIITATYNSSKTLRDTIESVLNQNYNNIEYIIIDGGSKDNTIDIIKEYEPKFNGRLKWISEKDNGIYDAMNKGICLSSGEVVGILNSDDFYTTNNSIENIIVGFDSNTDMVYGDLHFVNPNDLNKCIRYYSSKIFKRGLMRFGFMPAHPTCYIRKNIYDRYDLYNTKYKIASDFELLLRYIFINKIRIKYLPFDFVTMRTGGASTESLGSRKLIFKEHIIALKENKVYSNSFLLSLRYIYKVYELVFIKA